MELQRQLQRTNADPDNFIYTACHDLKARIANIEGLLLALEHELPAAYLSKPLTQQQIEQVVQQHFI